MAIEEYVGSIVMEIDGREVEITDLSPAHETGRKLVKTMNRSRRAKGITRGIATYELDVTAVIPVPDNLVWEDIEGARITLDPMIEGAPRTTYQDCFTISVGEKYTVDSEARVDIKMGALRKVLE
ncbi:phage tail protein [Salmonella enterica]|uniref:Phage tail protein n=1 Tax=Salmonella enterica TaxID=28901 RepID=A0A5Y9P6L7_SALER|nr:phage tail protein [Salmonella enterica]EAW1667231.1 phage tail protein [Salmonella enterica subsp. enterica]EBV3858924.1 phage tail protein [Salmonella enterica subsp. enterica serovar Montevideo]EBY3036452.1 phage tail protein [Salmonella enterica subsp. enterica serovar Thompson]ECU7986881.1 phage tail protein [Salmonella enterica subsp. enterica serovar Oranienburg]EHT6345777.1 phage tail protein [Salmonella enterica subsp. enterica serovar Infantis]